MTMVVTPVNDPDAPPVLIFAGGADTLQLQEGGKVYRPGDALPRMSQARKNELRAAGILLTTRHAEPVVTPEGQPATMAAAAQVEGPAVVEAVEDVPKEANQPKDEPSPSRATRKGQ